MKAYLELIGSSIAFAAFALALLYAAPLKADPIGDLVDAVFGPHEAPTMQEHCKSNVCARRERLRVFYRTPDGGAHTMVASYYGGGGRERLNARTASGERFNPHGFTAAHRSLPFGTLLSVCYRGCATVRVNDRGPAAWTGRSLDLSRGAAGAIGMIGAGVARVRVVTAGE